jgi:hypothetical protein
MGDDCARSDLGRVGGDLVHENIVVVRIVVEHDQCPDPGRIGEAHPFLPSRMPPMLVRRVFLVSIGAVVNHHIGVIDEPQHVGVEPAGLMLGIGDVGNRLAVVFDAVAGGPVRQLRNRERRASP